MLDQRFPVSVHIMTALAYRRGELMTSEQLASSIRTNPTVVRRLLSRLAEAGLLESFKGKSGGVRVSRSPKEISLKEIYAAVSDKKLIQAPKKEPYRSCAVSCAMKKLLDDLVDGVEKNSMSYLSKIKLSDLISKV